MFLLTAFLLLSSAKQGLFDTIVHIPFVCIDNRIVLKLKTNQNREVNFVFDSGVPGILLDSTTAGDYNLIDSKTPARSLPFATHGNITSQFFKNAHIFKDSSLNILYSWGNAINFDNMPKTKYLGDQSKIKISGIIGQSLEGRIFDSCVLLLDFKTGYLSLIRYSIAFKPDFVDDSIKMVYSNDGFENKRVSFTKMLPSAKIEINLSRDNKISTNAFFDTGCQYDFLLLSCSHTDSLTNLLDETQKHTVKSATTSNSIYPIYSFNIDSLTIGNHLMKREPTISATMTNVVGLSSFGSSKVGVLIGVDFLKKFKKVYFDYPGKEIYFVR